MFEREKVRRINEMRSNYIPKGDITQPEGLGFPQATSRTRYCRDVAETFLWSKVAAELHSAWTLRLRSEAGTFLCVVKNRC